MDSNTSSHPCEISIDPNGIRDLTKYLERWQGRYSSIALISDDAVYPLLGELIEKKISCLKIPVHTIILPAGETAKNINSAVDCWTKMQRVGMDRKSLVVSLGGGVLSDVAGFVASTFMRGIDIIHLPTTLLGMVDAAIGGKTGINLPEAKNIVGTFHHPKMILIDPSCLSSLPARQISAGLAEVVKYGVIWDAELFHYLDQNMEQLLALQPEKMATIISRSCQIKAEIVRQDPKEENGIRALMNYGHTFGHAIESLTDYKTFVHGEAVAIGMSCAGYLSKHFGFVKQDFIEKQDQLLQKAHLPTKLPKSPLESIVEKMAHDKKATAGKITCILARGIGKAEKMTNIDKKMILDALNEKIANDQ